MTLTGDGHLDEGDFHKYLQTWPERNVDEGNLCQCSDLLPNLSSKNGKHVKCENKMQITIR